MRIRDASWLVLILALVLSVGLELSSSAVHPVVAVNGAEITAPTVVDTGLVPGSRLNLTIQVLNLGPRPEDMDAWQFRLELNASILRITRVINGPVLDDIAEDSGGVTLYSRSFNATTGTAEANELLIIDTPQPVDAGFTGSGNLAYVEVSVLALGVSFINFTNTQSPEDPPTKLRDIDGTSFADISHDSVNGVFANVPYNLPPVADFSFTPSLVIAGRPVSFDASASLDPDGTIVQYSWDFGDGSPTLNESDPVTEHIYTETGLQANVVLTVTDDGARTGSAMTSFYVGSGARHDLAVVGLQAPPNATAGDLVEIIVDVLNNGTFAEELDVNMIIIGPGWDIALIFHLQLAPGASTSITFSWETRGRDPGIYDIRGSAYLPLGVTDDNPANNSLFTQMVMEAFPRPDTVVRSIQVLDRSVGMGEVVRISVLVENIGMKAASFNLTTRYDSIVIETRPVALDPSDSVLHTFAWNTTGVESAAYVISAEASPSVGENVLSNNHLTGGAVEILAEPPKEVDTSPLGMLVTVGSTYLPGDTVVVYLETSHDGSVVDVDTDKIEAALFRGGILVGTLQATRISLGLYQFEYLIPADATPAQYSVRVSARYELANPSVQSNGVMIKTFLLDQRPAHVAWFTRQIPQIALGAGVVVAGAGFLLARRRRSTRRVSHEKDERAH
jgi:PKD repeat protein